jgi:murein endopeptidase
MEDHRSHQSGRDVDISYYQKRCGVDGCAFRRLGAADLDVARQWELLRYWLSRDQLEAAFIDYSLQAALYRHARSQGATREQLARWFQYPRGKDNPYGVVRHFPQHDDHMHLRFTCHDTDPECRAFRVW